MKIYHSLSLPLPSPYPLLICSFYFPSLWKGDGKAEIRTRRVRICNKKQEGLSKGRAEGRAEVARNLKQMGLATEAIIKATGLTTEEIEVL